MGEIVKRRCDSCLWWQWDGDGDVVERHGLCRYVQPRDRVSPAVWPITLASDFCAAWEPRDRLLIRCETCEFGCFAGGIGDGLCMLSPPQKDGYPSVRACAHCSHWRLKEDRNDG